MTRRTLRHFSTSSRAACALVGLLGLASVPVGCAAAESTGTVPEPGAEGGVPSTLPDGGSVAAPDGGQAGGDGGSIGAPTPAPPPPGCDEAKPLNQQPACVTDTFAVFVDPTNGEDGRAGTKSAPVKTIGKALAVANGKRIYVCEGTLDEAVTVGVETTLQGGFACGAWTATTTTPKLTASAGIPLTVGDATKVRIADFEIASAASAAPGESSIAVFVVRTEVDIVRTKITGGNAAEGAAGATAAANFTTPSAATGASSTYSELLGRWVGGIATSNACLVFGTSTGGQGGRPGTAGSATPAPAVVGLLDGARGGQPRGDEGAGGSPGAPGVAGAATTSSGSLSAAGWTRSDGAPGNYGNPGGGGGGGYHADGALVGASKAGGGGPGGCGGASGGGGQSGGSSFAVAAVDATIRLAAATIAGGQAGAGGQGGAGTSGQGGGARGFSAPGQFNSHGGAGGAGGAGSGGSGGAGGNSAAIAYVGRPPIIDGASTLTAAATAPGGAGGAGGTGIVGLPNGANGEIGAAGRSGPSLGL